MCVCRFLLRNHIVQEAIEDAENGSLTRARMLLKLMENPYSEEPANFILAEFADEFDQGLIRFMTFLHRIIIIIITIVC